MLELLQRNKRKDYKRELQNLLNNSKGSEKPNEEGECMANLIRYSGKVSIIRNCVKCGNKADLHNNNIIKCRNCNNSAEGTTPDEVIQKWNFSKI